MGRRSDHTRDELREIIIREGHRQMEEAGFARFSAREVAKRIGYSIGTLYNVFGSYDHLILAINGRTLDLWLAYLERRLAGVEDDRLHVAVDAYFQFALDHRHAWTALFDFRLPEGEAPPEDYAVKLTAIVDAVEREVASELPPEHADKAPALTRSLLATVHGHCFFALNGTFELLGVTDPLGTALERVRDALDRYRQNRE
ncbi:MAG: TetR/AcrR family transcriptional regulator [Novosphingobium sp.]|nr:TetR/AcrR family transcriptional regulator [Novosphingobium sp.]